VVTEVRDEQAGAQRALAPADQELLQQLEELVRDTHLLWDQEWVGFSWRNYTFEHMQRVRGLARTLGRVEGADRRVLEFAATLHDVTKSYDGDILVGSDGKRVVDEYGFWRNATLPPARANKVTRLYDELGLAGTVHSISGGRIADALLDEAGFATDFRACVDRAVREHLIAGPGASLEGQVLNDADTIDANIGLPAFYRNIQISLHREDEQHGRRGQSFVEWLRHNLPAYLQIYLKEKIPAWVDGKQRDFVGKLNTPAARQVAEQRIERLRQVNQQLVAELEALDQALEHGGLAVVRYFMENRNNPRLTEQLALLEQRWADSAVVPTVGDLLRQIRQEVDGDF
jgi:HD superfamily phosphodiesterase